MPRPPRGNPYPRRVSAQEVTQALGPLDALQPIGSQSGSGECWLTRTGADELVLKIVVHEHEPGRFQREVRALERLNSPRVMQVHDHGEINTASGLYPYLRSEFVPGGDLREHLTAVPAPDDGTIRSFQVERFDSNLTVCVLRSRGSRHIMTGGPGF